MSRRTRPPAVTAPAGAAGRLASAPPAGDPLSDVLRTVRLTGALFFLVEASDPWTMEVPDGTRLAPATLPGAQQVISYHVVTRGSCWGGLQGGPVMRVEKGDILVFPRGDAYVMAMGRDAGRGPDHAEVLAFMRAMGAGRLPFTVVEGGGGRHRLHLVCGFLGCDLRPFNPLLASLPPVLVVRGAWASPADPLGQLIALALGESRQPRAGADSVRLRLSELMFVEVIRRHLASLPATDTGWLAGLRDPVIGRAVALLHGEPARAWTLPGLAREVALSRTGLARRFTHLIGQPPMQYLARWRMQVAARLLADGDAKVAAVAAEVGYESEAAFSRAFKKAAGVAPAAWRRRRARSSRPVGDGRREVPGPVRP